MICSSYSYAASDSFKIDLVQFNLDIKLGVVLVKKNNILIFEKKAIENNTDSAFIEDFNFDKIPDFAILRDTGIERYFEVYIFDKKINSYVLNKEISSLACPTVDSKKKIILSTCNHANACEGWQDTYKLRSNELKMVRRDGTTCDPVSGQGFKYYEIYRDGKIIYKKTMPIKN